MAETDILNPTQGWWRAINDNPNPSYGTPRKTSNNNALARARMGAPYSRDTMNQGYGFEFYYINRPWTTVERLQHFYHQYKGGYFTYIDYDGGGRHHVGRFTSPVNATPVANDKYVIQSLVFEEMPRARMLQYPSDFINWSRSINVVDDYLNPAVATFVGAPRVNSAWVAQLDPTKTGASATDPSAYEMYTSNAAVGDYAQIEYVGWGFQMKFRTDASFGTALLYLDGVQILSIDLTSGAYSGAVSGLTVTSGVITYTGVPLDVHRIKVVANSAAAFIFPQVKVIV